MKFVNTTEYIFIVGIMPKEGFTEQLPNKLSFGKLSLYDVGQIPHTSQ